MFVRDADQQRRSSAHRVTVRQRTEGFVPRNRAWRAAVFVRLPLLPGPRINRVGDMVSRVYNWITAMRWLA